MSELPKSLNIVRGLPPRRQLDHVIDKLEDLYQILKREIPLMVRVIDGEFNVPAIITHTGTFGGIHVHDNAVDQSVATGASYSICTAWADNDPSAGGVTPDATNNKITVTRAGYYQLTCTAQFSCGTNNVEWFLAPFIGGVEHDEIHIHRKIGTAGDVGSAGMVGILDVASVPVDIDIRARHDNGGAVNLNIQYGNCSLIYLGET